MVWAGIFLNGRTDLIEIDGGSLTGVRYRDEVLRPVVVPIARAIGQNFILMQDNDCAHIAYVSWTMTELGLWTGLQGHLT